MSDSITWFLDFRLKLKRRKGKDSVKQRMLLLKSLHPWVFQELEVPSTCKIVLEILLLFFLWLDFIRPRFVDRYLTLVLSISPLLLKNSDLLFLRDNHKSYTFSLNWDQRYLN